MVDDCSLLLSSVLVKFTPVAEIQQREGSQGEISFHRWRLALDHGKAGSPLGQHAARSSEMAPVLLLTLLLPEPWQGRVAAASEEKTGEVLPKKGEGSICWWSCCFQPSRLQGVADLQIPPSQSFTWLWPPFCHKPWRWQLQKSFLPLLLSSLNKQC